MTEISVPQRSPEWFDLRQSVSLTASNFGDAIGVGIGKPFHFLQSLIHAHPNTSKDSSPLAKHGLDMEPVICEAYELLSWCQTEAAGFWIPKESDPLYRKIGASPDAKVLSTSGSVMGLAEFKAPVFTMYKQGPMVPHGIPRNYMAQIQGQMAICEQPWCDFMAVCCRTKEIILKRVYFQPAYWTTVSSILGEFCRVLEEAQRRHSQDLEPFSFPAAETLRGKPAVKTLFSGEKLISVEDLLQKDKDKFKLASRTLWMNYNFLMGTPCSLEENLQSNDCKKLGQLDRNLF